MWGQLGVGVWLSQGPDESWAVTDGRVPWEWNGMRGWDWDRKGTGDEMGQEPGQCKGLGQE